MTKKYKVTQEKFKEAIELINRNGGALYRDGTFEVQGVEGTYIYKNEQLLIKILDKPWFASWDMIEEKLHEFFS